METLTKEQIEQKKQQLAEKWEEIKALLEDLKNAGITELSDEDLEEATGGGTYHYDFLEERFKTFTQSTVYKETMKWIQEQEQARRDEARRSKFEPLTAMGQFGKSNA